MLRFTFAVNSLITNFTSAFISILRLNTQAIMFTRICGPTMIFNWRFKYGYVMIRMIRKHSIIVVVKFNDDRNTNINERVCLQLSKV